MYVYVLDKDLKRIGLIDNYVSLIWTTRYYLCGDFELYVPVTSEFIELLQIGRYVQIENNEYTMIIESINIKTDAENGNYMTISGRSAESLLDRRIVSNRISLTPYGIEDAHNYLIENNFTKPSNSERIMNEIAISTTKKGFSDPITAQYFGDNIYEIISNNCINYGYGFKMPLVNNKFTFEMYSGVNRTRSQKDNNPAVFSAEFENLVNTEYLYNIQDFKNVAFVAGEGEGVARKKTFAGSASGIDRREMYVDARDLSSENVSSDSQYLEMLAGRGKEKLSEKIALPEYVGEVANFPEYCGLGDIVEVENEFGMTATARITEIIESYSTDGNTRIPTFDEWSV